MQFEQLVNALYIDKLRYGEYHQYVNAKDIKNFISRIPGYAQNLKSYEHDKNRKLFSEIDKSIRQLVK